MYTPINQYIERLENISFDVDKLNDAVSELIKIRPFENSEQKPGMLKSNAICLNYDEKELDEWFGGNIRGNIGQNQTLHLKKWRGSHTLMKQGTRSLTQN